MFVREQARAARAALAQAEGEVAAKEAEVKEAAAKKAASNWKKAAEEQRQKTKQKGSTVAKFMS